MAKEKKGAKFGRHSRNPSSKLQSQRTARNKRLRIAKFGESPLTFADMSADERARHAARAKAGAKPDPTIYTSAFARRAAA